MEDSVHPNISGNNKNIMILVGSKYFFSQYSDFCPHDTDVVDLQENFRFNYMKYIRIHNIDHFLVKKKPKHQMIQDVLEHNKPLEICKFLVPEFNNEIGFTIDDLANFQAMVDQIDKKHEYVKIIYESYLLNGSFTLSQEQRDKVYQKYKEARQ